MLQALKEKIAQTKDKVLETVKIPEEQRNIRFDICKSCEDFTKFEFCKQCGCFMPAKTWIPSASCPIQKWKAVDENKISKL